MFPDDLDISGLNILYFLSENTGSKLDPLKRRKSSRNLIGLRQNVEIKKLKFFYPFW